MKAAPVISAIRGEPSLGQLVVHTGQHYGERMSGLFFRQLGLEPPDANLDVGSGSHAVQTAEIMRRLEPLLIDRQPEVVLVYGDVNSTMAAAIVAAKLQIPIGHVEAGLRSGDRTMPEEINRIVTDAVADLYFTHSADADENLKAAGVPTEKIHFVGNCMIDTLIRMLQHSVRPELPGLDDRFALVTLHRPSNVDDARMLERILRSLLEISRSIPIVFPVHPRTRARLPEGGLGVPPPARLVLAEPQGYLEFLWLQQHATLVITDSGGVQEETTYLQVPCLTLRRHTERPVTVTCGTNVLVGDDLQRLEREVHTILDGGAKAGTIPPRWDGRAGERVAAILARSAANGARASR
jgi:UDP-N-acetylglucosamine 2-epimerase (non-hydrolysing)